MIPSLPGRGKLAAALAGLLLGCVAAPVRGDDLRYLPDNVQIT